MTDPIKALLAAFEAIANAYALSPYVIVDMEPAIMAAKDAIKALAAAEARPEPDPRGATKLREPLPGRAGIAIRVGANTMSGSCLIADIGKDVAELAGIMMRRHGSEAASLEAMRKERQGHIEASLAVKFQRSTGPDWMTAGVMKTALRDAAAGPFVAEVLRLREVAAALIQECRDKDEALHQMAGAHMMTKRKLAEAQARIESVVDLHAEIAERIDGRGCTSLHYSMGHKRHLQCEREIGHIGMHANAWGGNSCQWGEEQ